MTGGYPLQFAHADRLRPLIGYARCSTDKQDLEANRQILPDLGVDPEHIHLDRAYSGTTRARPGLDKALVAVRAGDTLVVPKLDRLARSVRDAREIGDSLVARNIRLQLGTMVYDILARTGLLPGVRDRRSHWWFRPEHLDTIYRARISEERGQLVAIQS